MDDKYIYAYQTIDIEYTEQFGGFFSYFLELIFICLKTNRTLILPNVFLAPRNDLECQISGNTSINMVESVDIRHFIDVEWLSKYIKICTLANFYMMKKSVCVLTREKEIPQHLGTEFGIIKVDKAFVCETTGISMIPHISSLQDEVICLYNYVRTGHLKCLTMIPYKQVRSMIRFSKKLYKMADEYMESIGLDTNTCLALHWRRSDYVSFANSSRVPEDTREFYRSILDNSTPDKVLSRIKELRCFSHIKTIFLCTNNGDNNDLDILKQLKINIYTYKDEKSDLKYQNEGIVSIIIGSRCKYQLHMSGFNQFRISNFGRIMMEEGAINGREIEVYFSKKE